MSNVIYGNPNQIQVFEEWELKKQYEQTRKSGKKQTEKLFVFDSILKNNYDSMLKTVANVGSGQTLECTISHETSDHIVLTYPGAKDDIYVDKSRKEIPFFQNKVAGDKISVLITQVNSNPYLIEGSVSSLYEEKIKNELKAGPSENDPVDALVKMWTPAGYTLDIYYEDIVIPGFMPNTLAGVNKLHDVQSIVGETFKVVIESYSEDKKTYIVSRRKYLQTLIRQEIKRLRYDVVYNGHVTGTTPFGVFVEFNGCLTGMIHKTSVHPDWQDRLDQIKPGTEVPFYIKEIIKDKIILTQIEKDSLWDSIEEGQKFKGVVKDIKAFGVLVNLDEETVGLIKTVEVEKTSLKVTQKQEINVRVSGLDRASRKIFLTVSNN